MIRWSVRHCGTSSSLITWALSCCWASSLCLTVFLTTTWRWATWAAMVTSLPVCTASGSTLVATFEVENKDDAVFTRSVRARPPSLAAAQRECALHSRPLFRAHLGWRHDGWRHASGNIRPRGLQQPVEGRTTRKRGNVWTLPKQTVGKTWKLRPIAQYTWPTHQPSLFETYCRTPASSPTQPQRRRKQF